MIEFFPLAWSKGYVASPEESLFEKYVARKRSINLIFKNHYQIYIKYIDVFIQMVLFLKDNFLGLHPILWILSW